MSATKLYFPAGIDYVDIAGRSSVRGRQTRVGWGNKLFWSEMRQYLENGRRYVQSYY